jgi:dihydrofolate synthase/folylpolyglutamate synthase
MPASLPEPVDLDDLLEPFAKRGVDLGLERLLRALAEGGHPERRFAAVQVAGTNGKGSITTFLEAILRAAGLRCGAYRSPHLVSWCERISLDDHWIDPATLRADLARWRPIGQRHDLTPFELLTAAAFDRFAAADLDLTVLEVGLGGRLDATTAHPHRPVVGFGAIGLDHCEHLGPDLASIAREKAGVLAAGVVAISAAQPPEAARVLEAEAQRLGAELRWVGPLPPVAEGGPELGLAGSFQRHNAAVAVAMAEALWEGAWPRPGLPLETAAIQAGLAAARWPGRLEMRHFRGHPLLLDGAHNPPAAAVLRHELDRLAPGPRRWLIGIQRHKDGPAILERLLGPLDRALVVPIPEHQCWSRDALADACPALAPQLEGAADAFVGLERLVTAAPTAGSSAAMAMASCPVIAGSLHLLGLVIPWLDPPRPA